VAGYWITVADEEKEKIQLSLAQVAASSLAAVSAAIVCSFFGVAGTVIGTAIASVCATVGSALYAHSLRRTKARLRQLHQAGAASPPLTDVLETTKRQWRRWASQIPWRRVGLGAAGVFVFSIALVTVVELGVGKPLSALFGVGGSGDRGTTLGTVVGGKKHHHSPSHSPSPTTTSSSSPSPTSSTTSSPTRPPTSPTPTPTPTPSVTPTKPTPTPTPSVTPSSPSASATPN
jgi:hypothetical protein